MMIKFLLFFCVCLALARQRNGYQSCPESQNLFTCNEQRIQQVLDDSWHAFKEQYGKHYINLTAEMYHKKAFEKNFLNVLQHNLLKGNESGFQLAINHLSDMELRYVIMGDHQRMPLPESSSPFSKSWENISVPDSWDWRTHGGRCNAAWAFGVVGAVEAQNAISNGRLVELSEQNLLDCSGAGACYGGITDLAMWYIVNNHGIDTEEAYPYTKKPGVCRFSEKNVGALVTSFNVLQGEEEVKRAVALHGPVTTRIDAGHYSFQNYKSGVYYEPKCNPEVAHYGVLIVGYGTDEKFGDYWIVKNSWGPDWGENGYIRLARNRDNHCGIVTWTLLPVVNASLAMA